MLIDAHVHCAPNSLCARCQPEEIPALMQAKGIDGIVLSNHCYGDHLKQFGEPDAQVAAFLDAYRRCRAAGAAIGFPVLFGAEIMLVNVEHRPEILLFGLTEEQFVEGFPFHTRTLEDLYDFCEEHDILMSQAHPMRARQNCVPADFRYLHALESCNPGFDGPTHIGELHRMAMEHHLFETAGSDFHAAFTAGLCAMIVPDGITTSGELRDAIRAGKTSWTLRR